MKLSYDRIQSEIFTAREMRSRAMAAIIRTHTTAMARHASSLAAKMHGGIETLARGLSHS